MRQRLRKCGAHLPYDGLPTWDTSTGDGVADEGSLRGLEVVAARIRDEIQKVVAEAGTR